MEERINEHINKNIGYIVESLKRMENKEEERVNNRGDLLMKAFRD